MSTIPDGASTIVARMAIAWAIAQDAYVRWKQHHPDWESLSEEDIIREYSRMYTSAYDKVGKKYEEPT